jgi:hypothetical protein
LTYASLVAEGNDVTVFEKEARAGGAFHYAGKAPLFQEVVASERASRDISMTSSPHVAAKASNSAGDAMSPPSRACSRPSTAS